MSLPPREAWIEISAATLEVISPLGRFPRGKRGLKSGAVRTCTAPNGVASPAGSVD